MTIDGVISTRRGNGGSWTLMIGKSPIGEWKLAFPPTPPDDPDPLSPENLFKNEQIEDILFVITYSGQTPGWPE
jgi:hypothetical protein